MAGRKRSRATTDLAQVRTLQRWYEGRLADIATRYRRDEQVAGALAQLMVVSCAHLLQRLTTEDTPAEVKDTIALRSMPLFAIHARLEGKPAAVAQSAEEAEQTAVVLAAYDNEPPNDPVH